MNIEERRAWAEYNKSFIEPDYEEDQEEIEDAGFCSSCKEACSGFGYVNSFGEDCITSSCCDANVVECIDE